jgi:serine/threonine protein phosphatase PrpC
MTRFFSRTKLPKPAAAAAAAAAPSAASAAEGSQSVVISQAFSWHSRVNSLDDDGIHPSHNNQDRVEACEISPDVKPEQFIKDFTGEMHREINEKKEYHAVIGSTCCMAIFNPLSSKITVGNLGDSRIYLELENDKGERILVSLTEDFDPKKVRFLRKIHDNKGWCSEKGRLKPMSNKDRSSGKDDKDTLGVLGGFGDTLFPVIREVDVIEWNLKEIKENPLFNGFSPKRIMACSDGFTDVEASFGNHYKAIYKLTVEPSQDPKSPPTKNFNDILAVMSAENFKRNERNIRGDKVKTKTEDYSVENLTKLARVKFSRDDITVAVIVLEKLLAALKDHSLAQNSVLIILCDGHGKEKVEGELSEHIVKSAISKALATLERKPEQTPSTGSHPVTQSQLQPYPERITSV